MLIKKTSPTISQVLSWAKKLLLEKAIPSAGLDAEILLELATKKNRSYFLAHDKEIILQNQIKKFQKLIRLRAKKTPTAYLTGKKEFFGLDFFVNKHTLIPRKETEELVELALEKIKSNVFPSKEKINLNIIDIGTGSGCIIISLAKKLQEIFHFDFKKENFSLNFSASDISTDALKIAKKNAAFHNVNQKIKFLKGNLLEPFLIFTQKNSSKLFKREAKNQTFILANLPYLCEKIYRSAENDVKKFEPKTALFSEKNGLAHYLELFEQIKDNAKEIEKLWGDLILILEFSPEQKKPLEKIAHDYFSNAKIEFKKDLAEKWRLALIKIGGKPPITP